MSEKTFTIHRAWLVAAVTFLVSITAAAFRSTTSVLYMPIEDEFGWTRDLTSGAVALNIVVYGLTAPFAAMFIGRFGIKRIILFALVLIAAGTGLSTFITAPWQLYITWGLFVGVGTGALALILGTAVANTWFVKHRSLITGIFSAANATGQLLFLPSITQYAQTDGWRNAEWVIAGFALLVIPIVLFFFKNSPAEANTTPYGGTLADIPNKPPVTLRGNFEVIAKATRSKAFWALALTFFVCGWTTNGLIGVHFIPAAHDHGMPVTLAAGLLATVGIFDFVGTILSGWLTDRYNPAVLLIVYYGLRGVALFTVPFVLGPDIQPPLWFFVFFYGLDWIATVPPTVELCRRYFGLSHSPIVYSWVFVSHMVGAAIASAFAGFIRQFQGDYFIAWMTAGVACLLASAYCLTLLKAPKVAAIN